MNLIGCFELTDQQIMLDMGIPTVEILQEAKNELQRMDLSYFDDGVVFIPRAYRYNEMWAKSEKTKASVKKSVSLIPVRFQKMFLKQYPEVGTFEPAFTSKVPAWKSKYTKVTSL
jgi:hypothetical protein